MEIAWHMLSSTDQFLSRIAEWSGKCMGYTFVLREASMLGLALRTYVNRNGALNAVVYVFKKDLEVGDKLATCHGLKATVGFMAPFQ
ncbi:hypothetical protein ColLi_09082 [Colletotrichum liriopes]|uniref:DNA-directed RNA polymerase n=1 Tax=Colletotrichum liriopes TaxID=708192 RepID=A0AA37LVF4_9PEZI|nr:hypothetical protein ColLi_09082 [Colletotrichum liriopes]